MENQFIKIQDYLDDLLPEEERQLFEKELVINRELRDETELQRKINNTIHSRIEAQQGLMALQSTLANSKKQYFESVISDNENIEPSPKVLPLKRWGITIAVAACLLMGLNFLGIFNSNLGQLPSLSSEVTRGSEDPGLLTDAISSFNEKDYKKSIQLFSELSVSNPTGARFQYYLALSYIGDKRWSEAIDTAIPIAEGTSLYHEDAAYFAALAALKLNDNNLALNYANKVSENSAYYKKAQRIIKKVK